MSNNNFRKINLFYAICLVVGNTIGVSIFIMPNMIANYIPSSPYYLLAWIAGGVLAISGAVVYGRLGRLFPKSGGDYVFLREAYGELIAFLSGWAAMLITFSGSIAIMSVGLFKYQGVEIFGQWLTSSCVNISFVEYGIEYSLTWIQVYAVVAIWVLTLINVLGIIINARFQMVLIASVVITLFIFGTMALINNPSTINSIEFSNGINLIKLNDISGFLLALIPIFFAYAGWNVAVYIGEEIKNPSKNLSLSLIIGTIIVIIVYIFLNVIYLMIVGIENFDNAPNIGATVVQLVFGQDWCKWVNIIILLLILTSINSTIMAGSRIYYAMAKDKSFFFKSVKKIHPYFKTPYVSLIFQAIWTSILILTNTFKQLVIYSTSMMMIISIFIVFSYFIFHSKKLFATKKIKTRIWTHLSAIFYMVYCLLILGNVIYKEPINFSIGVIILLGGVPFYFVLKIKSKNN